MAVISQKFLNREKYRTINRNIKINGWQLLHVDYDFPGDNTRGIITYESTPLNPTKTIMNRNQVIDALVNQYAVLNNVDVR